jgi:putative SOS response-associated peptidase YedK
MPFDRTGPQLSKTDQTFQPIVRLNRNTDERERVLMRWGLIPYWITVGEIQAELLKFRKADFRGTTGLFADCPSSVSNRW